jgi:hypothetical protein
MEAWSTLIELNGSCVKAVTQLAYQFDREHQVQTYLHGKRITSGDVTEREGARGAQA